MKNVTPLRGTFPFYGPEDRLSTGGKLFPQKAVVTGASSGIGATTARALAAAGFDVAVGYGSNALAAQALV
ncbi:MAG TPA: SDR family NAD(P)-dependent oxidoreductase, partial [Lentzea sp.]